MEKIPNDPPQMGAKSTTTSNHPSTPVTCGLAQNNIIVPVCPVCLRVEGVGPYIIYAVETM